jgi:hypothetical protein
MLHRQCIQYYVYLESLRHFTHLSCSHRSFFLLFCFVQPHEAPEGYDISTLQLDIRQDAIHWLRKLDTTVRQRHAVCIKAHLAGGLVDLDPPTVGEITVLGTVVEVLWSEDNAGVRFRIQGHGNIWSTSATHQTKRGEILTFASDEMVHAQVEPQNQILLLHRLAVEELLEVLLRLHRQIDVLH